MFRQQQRGATLLGMLIIAAILGLALFAGIRLLPLYMEYMAVARALEQTAKEEAGNTSPGTLRAAMDRRWTVEDIHSIDPKEIIITKVAAGYSMQAKYRAETPFISNVSLVVDFDKSVTVPGPQ